MSSISNVSYCITCNLMFECHFLFHFGVLLSYHVVVSKLSQICRACQVKIEFHSHRQKNITCFWFWRGAIVLIQEFGRYIEMLHNASPNNSMIMSLEKSDQGRVYLFECSRSVESHRSIVSWGGHFAKLFWNRKFLNLLQLGGS